MYLLAYEHYDFKTLLTRPLRPVLPSIRPRGPWTADRWTTFVRGGLLVSHESWPRNQSFIFESRNSYDTRHCTLYFEYCYTWLYTVDNRWTLYMIYRCTRYAFEHWLKVQIKNIIEMKECFEQKQNFYRYDFGKMRAWKRTNRVHLTLDVYTGSYIRVILIGHPLYRRVHMFAYTRIAYNHKQFVYSFILDNKHITNTSKWSRVNLECSLELKNRTFQN